MKSIFIYAASRSDNYSLKIAEWIADEIKNASNDEIEFSIHTPKELNIYNCNGCNGCFYTGNCSIDKLDGFGQIKNELLQSNLVILISPVYAHNVSGDMKVFIDRISHWLHLMRLAGKKSVSISVSSNNGNDYVDNYLHKILEWMGTEVIAKLSVTVDYPPMLKDEFFLKKQFPKICKKIASALDEGDFHSTSTQEIFFHSLKQNFEGKPSTDSAEVRYWLQSGMLEYDSFENFVRHKVLALV